MQTIIIFNTCIQFLFLLLASFHDTVLSGTSSSSALLSPPPRCRLGTSMVKTHGEGGGGEFPDADRQNEYRRSLGGGRSDGVASGWEESGKELLERFERLQLLFVPNAFEPGDAVDKVSSCIWAFLKLNTYTCQHTHVVLY